MFLSSDDVYVIIEPPPDLLIWVQRAAHLFPFTTEDFHFITSCNIFLFLKWCFLYLESRIESLDL
jgi:hypothetical protein